MQREHLVLSGYRELFCDYGAPKDSADRMFRRRRAGVLDFGQAAAEPPPTERALLVELVRHVLSVALSTS